MGPPLKLYVHNGLQEAGISHTVPARAHLPNRILNLLRPHLYSQALRIGNQRPKHKNVKQSGNSRD